jgi:hypothetical protein
MMTNWALDAAGLRVTVHGRTIKRQLSILIRFRTTKMLLNRGYDFDGCLLRSADLLDPLGCRKWALRLHRLSGDASSL